ncbi:dihydrofolate reductase [Mariniplasma anaerobium]|uniref:dihydrofolate reductase n=1 Tax=Mariniplasma anaerobium TaxID=2735436 RepID=A0A7U9XW26_9MOLU|nr:dihydrofolate reductase [Mariniplasma anaerobium]BCR35949.1 dihydrofolate reductase [Mariniplasma anaerobium]
MISMIWAMDENWLIGKDNLLPWHYPKDLQYFKNMTKDQSVIMGDLTYKSLKTYYKTKPLPFKKVYVANILDVTYTDAIHVKDIFEFIKHTKEDICVIGGKTIYQLMLPYADRLYITYVLKAHEGNVYFPKFNLSDFKLVSKKMEDQLIFATYERSKI